MTGPEHSLVVRDLDLDLDAFEGPFDLLLTLVLKEELELVDVEIADIVLAFVERLHARDPAPHEHGADDDGGQNAGANEGPGGWVRGALDLEASGEFLVLVAALLELKARELFGEAGLDFEDLDPDELAEELAERLANYRRFKEAAEWLEQRLAAEADRYFRVAPPPVAPVPRIQVEQQNPDGLAATLRVLAAEPPEPSLRHLALRYPPVSLFLDRFRAVLSRRRRLDFDEEVEGLSRIEQAVAFIALLELRKAGEIMLGQSAPLAPITAWTAHSA